MRWQAPTVGIAQPSVASAMARSMPPATVGTAVTVETSIGRDIDVGERDVGDVHEQVEGGRALGGEPGGRPLDDEHGRFTVAVLIPDGRDDGDLVGAVAVDDVADRPVQAPPAVGRVWRVTVSAPRASAPVIDPAATPPSHRACCASSPQWADRRRELRGRGDERRRVVGPPELLEQDRQLDPPHAETAVVLGDRQGGPVELDHRRPPSRGVGAVVDHRADERRRALLVDDAAHGVLQLALVVIEFEIHAGSIRLAVRVAAGVDEVEISLHPDENDNFTTTGNLREDDATPTSAPCRSMRPVASKFERDEQLWGSGTNRTC